MQTSLDSWFRPIVTAFVSPTNTTNVTSQSFLLDFGLSRGSLVWSNNCTQENVTNTAACTSYPTRVSGNLLNYTSYSEESFQTRFTENAGGFLAKGRVLNSQLGLLLTDGTYLNSVGSISNFVADQIWYDAWSYDQETPAGQIGLGSFSQYL